MNKTKKLTFLAFMSALGVVALFLGGITRVLDLTAVMAATALIFVCFEETRYYALLSYAVIGALAFLLPIEKSVSVEFLIFGIYPAVKPVFEKTPKVISFVLKFVFMTASFVGLTLLLQFVLGYPEVWYINVLFCVAGVVIYVVFDIFLTRFTIYYRLKLRHQLRLDRFFR